MFSFLEKPLDEIARKFLRGDVCAIQFPLQKQGKWIVIFAL